ncbi:MAG: hypothetical protein ACFB0C_15640 [Leptolyngbyaceae cyanobacterium]
MREKLRLFWGADKVVEFYLPIASGYKAGGGSLLGAGLEFAIGLPGYLATPLATVTTGFSYTSNAADLLAGSFVLPAADYQPSLATEQHHNLAYQLKISPVSGGHQVIQGAAIVAPAF